MNNYELPTRIEKIPLSKWTIFDVAGVQFCIFASAIIVFIASELFIKNEKIALIFFRYLFSLATLFFPIVWIRKRYSLSKEVLGLRKGHLGLPSLVSIGVITALIYSFLKRLSPLWRESALAAVNMPNLYAYLVLMPISISGFSTIVLVPISEEVMDRGFIYGYLRKKLGVSFGLVLQALLFSLLHVDYIYGDALYYIFNRFLTGIVLGVLYETTGSLYPSIICHGLFNYLVIIFSLAWV